VAVEEESHCGGAAERKSFRHNLQDSTAVTTVTVTARRDSMAAKACRVVVGSEGGERGERGESVCCVCITPMLMLDTQQQEQEQEQQEQEQEQQDVAEQLVTRQQPSPPPRLATPRRHLPWQQQRQHQRQRGECSDTLCRSDHRSCELLDLLQSRRAAACCGDGCIRLRCGHAFHQECIVSWLRHSISSSSPSAGELAPVAAAEPDTMVGSCPVCRQEIIRLPRSDCERDGGIGEASAVRLELAELTGISAHTPPTGRYVWKSNRRSTVLFRVVLAVVVCVVLVFSIRGVLRHEPDPEPAPGDHANTMPAGHYKGYASNVG
jgi:hypothetical protein